MLRIIFHALAAFQFGYAVYYDYNYVHLPTSVSPIASKFGGKWRFLTFINCGCQTLLFIISLLNDVFGTNEVSPRKPSVIRKFKDAFHVSIGFPVAMFVAITFWGLYAVDRELVFPKAVDPYFPVWLNHVMHTNIVVFTLGEHYSSFRSYPSKKKGLSVLSVFMLSYLIWTFVIYFKSGQWVYPVMEVLNWPLRILFIVVLLVFIQGLYLIGEKLNNVFWVNELKMIKSSKNKKSK